MKNFEKKAKPGINLLLFMEILLSLAFPISVVHHSYLFRPSDLIRAFQVNETAASAGVLPYKELADIIPTIFYRLYDMRYPIEKIQLIDEYGADDEISMAANNTSAFCFRPIAGTDTLSLHSYGLAIDINPLYNPYVYREVVSPAASPYDRETGTVPSPYFMTEEDSCVRLFKENGFDWGGDWDSPKDYQHFEYRKTAAR